MKKKRHVIRRCWVGFAENRPFRGRDPDYDVQTYEVFPNHAAARKCFQDVRKATLVIGGSETAYDGQSITFDLD